MKNMKLAVTMGTALVAMFAASAAQAGSAWEPGKMLECKQIGRAGSCFIMSTSGTEGALAEASDNQPSLGGKHGGDLDGNQPDGPAINPQSPPEDDTPPDDEGHGKHKGHGKGHGQNGNNENNGNNGNNGNNPQNPDQGNNGNHTGKGPHSQQNPEPNGNGNNG